MFLNLKNPLVIFDLETTGTNVVNDRIVEYSFVKVMPDGDVIKNTEKVNPERPIPLESSLIHGIYDKDVKDKPTFKAMAKELSSFLHGCDLAGFNILKFDVPVLVEEFLRADVDFDISKRKLLDAQKIFHMMEKRTLTAAYKFYCGKELVDAHSAEADTLATLEVLDAQIKRYEGESLMDLKGKVLGTIENNVETLHQITNDNMVDLAGRFVFNDDGIEVFNFGKHKGQAVEDVLKKESGYYDWMMKGDFPMDTKRKLTEIKLRGFQR
ncbi:DNA polymerase III subunit epsilon [Marivirga tractuosa]|uniref:Exonuclease RNase T and DNA polymerase III n=1 Tax=Marivirga tractuosa (strain ATCC 23168 / DSM 4126 / NBRC 15989 / NCIMB 1408 / VKM B-1430 / H-43) TaxID=643867 RepID=E4TKF1_MARTH|nr:3'-5' exonuclease [Marivirga tractuosa]ADR20131.1 Exonuclease RNase T and DNA polymerase III [Marivirga tractuosa DSM 4126]BDD15428.1 DNA polymerase III subunit epsilon [Marivirga tractuosa]